MTHDRTRDGQFRSPERQQRHEQVQEARRAADAALADTQAERRAQGRADAQAISSAIQSAGGARALSKADFQKQWSAMLAATRRGYGR